MSKRIRTTRQARIARGLAIARQMFRETLHPNCRCSVAPLGFRATIPAYVAGMESAAFETTLRLVTVTDEERADLRALTIEAAKLGITSDLIYPMARAWHTRLVKPEAIEAGYQAVRDSGVLQIDAPERNAVTWSVADAAIRAALEVQAGHITTKEATRG